MPARPIEEIQLLWFAEQLISPSRGVKGLFDCVDAFDAVVQRRGNKAGAWRDAGNEFRLIDWQFVLTACKKPEPRVQPIRETAGDHFDSFTGLGFGKEAI